MEEFRGADIGVLTWEEAHGSRWVRPTMLSHSRALLISPAPVPIRPGRGLIALD